MKPYKLESNNVFLIGFKYFNIQLLEYNPQNPVVVKESEMKTVCDIGTFEEYNALEIFDDVLSGKKLKKLARFLNDSHISVNREGLCYIPIKTSLGVRRHRLNDVFNWSEYGVKSSVQTIWNRVLIPDGTKTVIDYQDQKKLLEGFQNALEEKEKMIEDLKHRLLSSKQESLQEALKKLSDAKSELKSVKIQLDSTKVEVAVLQKEVKDKVAKAKELQNQLCEKKREMRKVSSELCDTKAEMKPTKDELKLQAKFKYNNMQLLKGLFFVVCVAGTVASMLLFLF